MLIKNQNIKGIEDLMILMMLIATMNWSIKERNEEAIRQILMQMNYRISKGIEDLMIWRRQIATMNCSIKEKMIRQLERFRYQYRI